MRAVNRRSADLQGSRYVPYGLLSKFARLSLLLDFPKGKIQKASFSYFRIIPLTFSLRYIKVYTRVYAYRRILSVREDWVKRHTLPRNCDATCVRCSHASVAVRKVSFIVFRGKFLYGDGVAYHAEEYSPHKAALFAGLLKAFQR